MNKNNPNANVGASELKSSGLEKIYSSADLFGKNNSVVINHRGVCYILRITQLGKLILTK